MYTDEEDWFKKEFLKRAIMLQNLNNNWQKVNLEKRKILQIKLDEKIQDEPNEKKTIIEKTNTQINTIVKRIANAENLEYRYRFQTVNPLCYYETFVQNQSMYMCSSCKSVYMLKNSVGSHWKIKHKNEEPKKIKLTMEEQRDFDIKAIAHSKFDFLSYFNYKHNFFIKFKVDRYAKLNYLAKTYPPKFIELKDNNKNSHKIKCFYCSYTADKRANFIEHYRMHQNKWYKEESDSKY